MAQTKSDGVTITGDGTDAKPLSIKSPLVLNSSSVKVTSNDGQTAISAESKQGYGIFAKASSGGTSAVWAYAESNANNAIIATHYGAGRAVDAQSESGTAGFFWTRGSAGVPSLVAEGGDNGDGAWVFGNKIGLNVGARTAEGSIIVGREQRRRGSIQSCK